MPVTVQTAKTATPPPVKKTVASKPNVADVNKIQAEREEGINGLFQVAGAIAMVTGQWADAGAFAMHGPNVSRETAALGTRYERVGNALDALSQVGPFTAILAATMPLVLQLAANHKRIPVSKLATFGVVNPDVLEGQMRLEAQRQEYEIRKAMEAEAEALKAEQEKVSA